MFDFEKQALFIKWLQSTSLSDAHGLFLFLRHFDTTPYYLIVGSLLAALLPRALGVKYIALLCVTSYSNHWLKRIFDLPRPGDLNPDLDLINLTNHFGFPSGAAMGSVLIGFLLHRHIKGITGIAFASLYILMVCLSRVYLGVHFPIDIAGGLLFGLCLCGLFIFYECFLEKRLEKLKFKAKLLCTIAALILLIGIHPVSLSYELSLLLVGLIIGKHLKLEDIKTNKTLSSVIAIIGILIFFVSTLSKIAAVKYLAMFLVGFWLAYGTHYSTISVTKKVNRA